MVVDDRSTEASEPEVEYYVSREDNETEEINRVGNESSDSDEDEVAVEPTSD